MSALAVFLEQYALVIVAVFIGTIGAAWLTYEELKHRRKLSAKADEEAKLAADPAFPPLKRPQAGQVVAYRTAEKSGERHTLLAPLELVPGRVNGAASVVVDATVHFQDFIGIGSSFTESAADLIQQMSPDSQKKITEACFSREKGIGYRVGRVHMNSCDFSKGNWACAPLKDLELRTFHLKNYEPTMLPLMRRAAEAAKDEKVNLLASPWSPPDWMKDVGRMQFGGKLRQDCADVWARYYVRFAKELEAIGLPLWAFTVQNEPMAQTMWENCLYSAEEERDFVRDHLGPTLEKSGMDVKLLVWDHNRDEMFARAKTIYSDPNAAKHIWGMGFHWYGDPRYEAWPDKAGMLRYENVQRVHEMRPDKHLVMTEGCQEGGPHLGEWQLGERYAENIIKDLNNWTTAWIDWNLVLDETGGPNHVGNLCSAPIIVVPSRDLILYQSSFYYMGHFSRYIRPGAKRVLVGTSRDALEATAFVNPDGTLAVVVLNQGDADLEFSLEHAGKVTWTSAPQHSITTFLLLCEESPPTK